MQVCRFDRGSVCHIPDCSDSALCQNAIGGLDCPEFLHHKAAPSTDSLPDCLQTAFTCSSKLITECMPPALLALTQQVRTEQSRGALVHCRNSLLTCASHAKKRVNLVHRLHSDRV